MACTAQCDQTTREDSSERMVMAAVVVRVDNDQQIIVWLVLAIFIGCLLTGIASFASSARVGMAGTCPIGANIKHQKSWPAKSRPPAVTLRH